MPPRRSSRARASVEATPAPVEPTQMKRKRNQQPVHELEEKENLVKPPAKSRRSSSDRLSNAASTRSRPSTRREPAEPAVEEEEVPESDEADDDDAEPPKKKKRPSLEKDSDSEEDDDEVEEKPKAKSRAAPVKRGRPSRVPIRSRRAQKPVDISSDEEEPAKSTVDGKMAEDEDEEEVSEFEELKPKPRRSQPVKRGRPSRASAQPRSSRAKKAAVILSDEEGGAADPDVKMDEEQNQKKPSSKPSTRFSEADDEKPVAIEEEEEEEEEQSLLLDHPPILPPSSQPQAKAILEEPKGPKPRLVIHKLALVNFKSYAGRQEIGPFHKSFSSIVGANGSGKSNTIDSLLFVFGYRASKMRQGKVSELIHNSARYPDLDHCTVEVYFREIIDLPGPDAFEIAYRDNTNKYFMNGRLSSYNEVQQLLKGRGIDLDHNRFLILQGEVESIALMKPKGGEHEDGLLEYLEDIIGTARFKEPIETAFYRARGSPGEPSGETEPFALVEKEKNSLEDKKKEAEDYLRLQNELARAQSKLYQWYIWRTLHSEAKLRTLITNVEQEIAEETEKNRDDIENLAKLEADYATFENAYKGLQKHVMAAAKEFAEHEKQQVGLKEKQKTCCSKVKKLKKSVGDAQSAFKAAQRTIEDSDEKIEKEKGKLEKYEESLIQEEKRTRNEFKTVFEQRLTCCLVDKTQQFYDQKEALQKDLQPWTAKNQYKANRDGHRSRAEEHLAKVKSEQEESKRLMDEAKKEKAELNSKKQAVNDKTFSQALEKEWRAKTSSSHQRSLVRLQDSGRLKGFHSGTIAEQYDVAITTACPALQNMVVDTKINISPSVLQTPSYSGKRTRLFDLIKPKDPKDTLVAKDMDQANRIAFGEKRTKVVTLRGGGMSAKLARDSVTPRQLQELEQERDQSQMKLEEAMRAVRSAEAELEQLNHAGPEIDLRYEKLKRVKDLKTHSKPDKSDLTRINTLEATLQKLEADVAGLKERAGEIEASLQEVEDKIMKIGGSKLMAQKSKVEGVRTHIALTNDAITTAEVAKAKAEKDVRKHDLTVENDGSCKLDEQLEQVEGYVQRLKSELEKAQEREENQREELADRKATLEAKAEEVEAFRQTEMKLKKTLDGHEKELKQATDQLTHFQASHDALTLEDIDEEEEDEAEEDEEPAQHEDKSVNEDEAHVKTEPPLDNEKKPEFRHWLTNELQKLKEREMRLDIGDLEDRIKRAKPNLNVLEEYRRREAEYLTRHDELEQVVALRDAQKTKYEALRKERFNEFTTGFGAISLKLKEMYQMITQGGNAELEMVDSMDPFAEGIIFSVMPPKKSWKNISNLSGGEKTLSSLALVFALHVFKPTPLYFMDEIDAALDFRNVSIIANYIKDRTKNAQFIIISLRNDMFELSHRLIGIYKTANVTQSISIDNHALTVRPVNSASLNKGSPSKSITGTAVDS
ncbi:RecF/RecN/SMC N terminal domain-containing protein [Rhodocollybia butyracea]|uniref:Structural maintenance of chromosomes protein 4 n=1 Tax=Rhodocollybia butyracea TaxID=206335 RepID=A0A9P5QCZ8_9AGAR|nr:RecF/RecN/SMC N terminal domain-containing protein [Rhodocollybia butyracea]